MKKRLYATVLTICFMGFISGLAVASQPHWIWGTPEANKEAIDGLCLFTKSFALPSIPAHGVLQITCDDQYVVRLNDRLIGVDENWQDIEQYDVTSILRKGENRLLVRARNLAQGPAGLLASLEIKLEKDNELKVVTDDTWDVSIQESGTWDPDAAKIKKWKKAVSVGNGMSGPWQDALTLNEHVSVGASNQQPRGAFELRDGDRVLFLGNTIIEREQRYGYWEAALTTRYPRSNIIFRNLGWSGDTVYGHSRARFGTQRAGFDHLEVHVHAVKPTVIICCYGSNAIFAGEAGLDDFVTGYELLLDALETTGATIVLMAPLRHEPVNGRFFNAEYNGRRELYVDAIERLAGHRNCQFIEMSQEDNQPLTDDGVHLTELGYWATAKHLEEALGLAPRINPVIDVDVASQSLEAVGASVLELAIEDDSVRFTAIPHMVDPITPVAFQDRVHAGTARHPYPMQVARLKIRGFSPGDYRVTVNERSATTLTVTAQELKQGIEMPGFHSRDGKLIEAIRAKNQLYFHRWRPQNETYLFLFRKHEQGNNAVEIPMFDPLVREAEQRIAQLRQPQPVKYVIRKK